ncbi:MAG: sorting protein [Verrucomicrobiales bacterium]|nr:sorting protein [Verrucomicrobiales bacterium]
MKIAALLLSLSLLLSTVSFGFGADTIYLSLPYRGRADSPFLQSIQNGTTYLEDFEDKLLNTPGLSTTHGIVFDSPTFSADEDDGRLDNIAFGWCLSANPGNPLPIGSPFSMEVMLGRDAFGHYPTHFGALYLQFARNVDPEGLRYFQAFDENGIQIFDEPLTALSPVLTGGANILDARGNRFFGLIHESGISRVLMGGGGNFDHIQYGYGSIPEPAVGVLSGVALGLISMRRRRRGRS